MYSQVTCTIQQIAFSKGALTALSDFDAWGSRRNPDTWTKIASFGPFNAGAAYGGYVGYKRAQFYGFNKVFGGSLDDKLDWMVQQEIGNLQNSIGNGNVQDFEVGNYKNFKEYHKHKRYSNLNGNIYDINYDRHARGVCIQGTVNQNSNGTIYFTNNLIFLSKNIVSSMWRNMWKGSNIAMSTLYHEYVHAVDYASGNADFLYKLFGNNNDLKYAMMEYHAYSFQYNMTGSNEHRNKMLEWYRKLPNINIISPIRINSIP